MTPLAIFVVLLFLYSLVSALVDRSRLTAPIVFTLTGVGAALLLAEPSGGDGHAGAFLTVAELGLVLLLFTDASRIDLKSVGGMSSLPARLLSVGMLLTIGLGMLAAMMVFGQLSIWEAGILAAILAPTDAGLGQAIVSSPKVPKRIREALNVEAGLNDGLAVPFLLFFIALAGAEAGQREARLLQLFAEQFGYGIVALPVTCMLASEAVGASMFIAAFVAGLAAQYGAGTHATSHSVEFAEDWGQVINLCVFFLFGLLTAGRWQQLEAVHFAYAALSLTVIRMLPVAIALIGSRMDRSTVLFMGWFGPRGLASIVLGLVYLEHGAEHHEPIIRLTVTATVLVSILAHGLSAKPGAARYGAKVAQLGPRAEENATLP
jgi:NhaP-type Na+/H+ or K+/H+ antiporter